MGRATIEITTELLAGVLRLPEGSKILDAKAPLLGIACHDTIELVVGHPDLPEGTVADAVRIRPLYAVENGEPRFVSWGLPEGSS